LLLGSIAAGCSQSEPTPWQNDSNFPDDPATTKDAEMSEATAGTESEPASRLTVTITGLRSDEGRVLCGLFSGEKSFDQKKDPFRAARLECKGGSCRCVFADVPHGEYAIAVFHDLNENRRLDTNVVGIPSEPYGFSRNASSPFGPPGYEDAKFQVRGPEMHLSIRVRPP
jgi:uncharacterized protein (DUF2141 family)